MSGYVYQEERPNIFTEVGLSMYTRLREYVLNRIEYSGAVQLYHIVDKANVSGDSFLKIACVDYMVEKGEIREVLQAHKPSGQYRVFVAAR